MKAKQADMIYGERPTFDAAAMDSLLSGAVERGEAPAASALIFDGGQVVYKNAFGLASVERGEPLTTDSVVRIYSMTKPVTSAAIMKLVEDGKIALSDPASQYVPQLATMQVLTGADEAGNPIFTAQSNPMTVEDLLLHRAGLAYGIFGQINPVEGLYESADLFNVDETLAQKMDKLGQLPLVAQPGEAWYCSFSIDVLGRIIEVASGQNFEDYLQDNFFDPLGMNDTGFYVRPDQQARFVSNYALTEDGSFALFDDSQDSDFVGEKAFKSGGGGLVSTLGDYARFCEMMLRGGALDGRRYLSEASVKAMMTDQMDADDAFLFPWFKDGNVRFGYGGSVVVSDTTEQVAVSGHAEGQWGWSGAARTTFYIDPSSDAFAIIFLQYFVADDPALHDQFRALAYAQTKD